MPINRGEVKRTNPNAMVFIYNYKDRMGSNNITSGKASFGVDQIILNTTSLISVTTSKSKSNPAGSFEITLAPTKNWVTAITPGSWCVILMSNSSIDDKAKYGGGKVDEKSFKMMGRIESVRAAINTNQTTAAKETRYIVQGSDWGTIFNTQFYVDPLNRAGNESPQSTAERFGYEEYLRNAIGYEPNKIGKDANSIPPALRQNLDKDQSKKPFQDLFNALKVGGNSSINEPSPVDTGNKTKDETLKLPSASDNINFLLQLWGRSDPATAATSSATGLLAKSKQVFTLPDKLAEYMDFKDNGGKRSAVISQTLRQVAGKLTGYDKYSGKDSSAGFIDFNTILGNHSFWQVLNSNNNGNINEIFPEIRFQNGKANMTLYNRVKPFAVNGENNILRDRKRVGDGQSAGGAIGQKNVGSDVAKDFISYFSNVRRKTIDLNDIISVNYGTNWRDKYNFIEVNIDRSLYQENYAKDIKEQSQFADEDAIGRDGLQPMIIQFSYVPAKAGIQDPLSTFVYKYPMKEWYFNTHKMLNGSIQMVGQDQYIQVGDNIIFPAEGFGEAKNISAAQKASRKLSYILAHVESVNHTAQVDPNGARSFVTNITFVRGVISDVKGNIISTDGNSGAVDQDASKVTPTVEKNLGVFGTSAANDPDRQKLKGK